MAPFVDLGPTPQEQRHMASKKEWEGGAVQVGACALDPPLPCAKAGGGAASGAWRRRLGCVSHRRWTSCCGSSPTPRRCGSATRPPTPPWPGRWCTWRCPSCGTSAWTPSVCPGPALRKRRVSESAGANLRLTSSPLFCAAKLRGLLDSLKGGGGGAVEAVPEHLRSGHRGL